MLDHYRLILNGREPSFFMSERIPVMSVCRGTAELNCSALGKLRNTVPTFMSFSCVLKILLLWSPCDRHTLPAVYIPSSLSTRPQWLFHSRRSPWPSLSILLMIKDNLESMLRCCRIKGAPSWRCRWLQRLQELTRRRLCAAAACAIWYMTAPKTSTHIIQLSNNQRIKLTLLQYSRTISPAFPEPTKRYRQRASKRV